MEKKKEASEALSEFLDFLDECERQYQTARDAVGLEDRRLQDLLHELEFAQDKSERNRVATKFQHSRRERRRQKDEVQRLELIVIFFNEQNHKNTVKKMRQLLGRQRKEEEFLRGKRTYKPRVKAD